MKIVLDTSVLLFWTLDCKRLSEAAAQAVDLAPETLISSISLWEIAWKQKQGKLALPMAPEVFAKNIESIKGVRIVPIDWATWLESVRLEWPHRDPADRCIVALARTHGCDLITSDEEIRKFYPQAIW